MEILNLEGHQNRTSGSKVILILLNWLIFPIGGASAVEGLRSTGLPRLVLNHDHEAKELFSIPDLVQNILKLGFGLSN